jgi:DNA replication protein DnaC
MVTLITDAELDRLEATHPELKGGCPTCKGKGYYKWQGTSHDCDCVQQKYLYTRYIRAGIGLSYQRLTWGDLGIEVPRRIAQYLDDAEEYIDRGIGLMISGTTGTGKTALAMLILKDLVKAGYDCAATTFAETVQSLIQSWSDDTEKKMFASRFMYSRVLVLDDLGKEFRNSFRNQLNPTTFDYILRTRVQESRPTILTTNMTFKEVLGDYGVAVLSLLAEQSIEIQLTGTDFRPTARDRAIAEVEAKERRPIT